MAKDFINIDSGFPSFVQDEPIEEKVSKLYNYTFMLLESLRYLLRNLDADNFNAAAVTEFKKAYEDKLTKAIADFEVKANEDYASAAMFAEFKTETEDNFKNQTDAFSKFQTEVSKDYAKISGLAEYDTIKEMDGKVSENTSAIAGVKGTADKNAASLEEITEWKGSKYESFEGGLEAAKSAAETAANGYTDGKITEAKTDIESKVYTKTQADSEFAKSETLTSYQSEVTQKFSAADTAAKGYADSAKDSAISSAKDYTDGKITEVTTDIESKVYTKTEANSNFASKSDFTSYQETVTQKFSEADDAAKGYADSAEANAKDAANGYTDDKFSVLSESFTDIEQKSDANGAFIKMMVGQAVKLVNGVLKGTDNTTITSASAAEFVMEAANGESEIKLKADRIRLGDGAGVDENGNLYFCRLFGPSDVVSGNCPGQFYLEIDSNFGFTENSVGADMLMKSVSSIDSYTGNEAVMYGFRYGSTKGNEGTSSVNFVVATDAAGGEKSIIGYNYNQDKVYPKGTWDFSSSEVSGLVVYFS